jgi:hypothetical protein
MVLMGVAGAGAGALLAMSMAPSFAPYRDRADSRPYSDESDGGLAYAQAHAAREQGTREPEQGLAVRLGPERGTLVLELPAWAGNTVEWMGFGRRVWDDWRQFSERFEGAPQEYLRQEPRETWRDTQPGYAEPYDEGGTSRLGYIERSRDRLTGELAQAAEPDAADLAARRAVDAVRDVLAAQDQ